MARAGPILHQLVSNRDLSPIGNIPGRKFESVPPRVDVTRQADTPRTRPGQARNGHGHCGHSADEGQVLRITAKRQAGGDQFARQVRPKKVQRFSRHKRDIVLAFRVEPIPEPFSITLLLAGFGCFWVLGSLRQNSDATKQPSFLAQCA